MAILEHEPSKRSFPLTARTLVGRSDVCQLRLSSPRVSGVHAELTWDGKRWTIRDLDSRNGTRLDGRELQPKQRQPMEPGSQVVFGTEDQRFTLIDPSPPGLVVIDDEGMLWSPRGGLMYLPSDDQGDLMLYERLGEGWWLETENETRKLVDQEQLSADGLHWRVFLPGLVEGTDETSVVMTVSSIALDFHVSRDEEHVALELRQGTRCFALNPRAHNVLLLNLGRARLADQQHPELEESEHGWVYVDDLASKLRVDRDRIKLWIHRARREFADAGVYDIAGLVERRRDSDQVRLGIARLRVGR